MIDNKVINIYCDESCHLESDKIPVMVLGGVWLPKDKIQDICFNIRKLKSKHGLGWNQEIKWNTISPKKLDLYLELVDFFFDNKPLHFRGLVIQNKDKLRHDDFNNQNHDDWYYKMYFSMLKQIFDKNFCYNIYLDIKDTRGGKKIRKLHDVICNSMYDFDKSIIKHFQLIRSEESEIIQLTDLLIGALSYHHRKLNTSQAKLAIIDRIKQHSKISLDKNTLIQERKFNLFLWQPQEL